MIPHLWEQVQYRSLTETRWQYRTTLTKWQCCTVRHSRTIDSVIVYNLTLTLISDCLWFVNKDSLASSCSSSYLFQWINSIIKRDDVNMKTSLTAECRSGPISETCYWGLVARSQQQELANIMIRRCLGDFVPINELQTTLPSELSLISSQTTFTDKIHVIHNTNNQMLSNWLYSAWHRATLLLWPKTPVYTRTFHILIFITPKVKSLQPKVATFKEGNPKRTVIYRIPISSSKAI